MIMKKFLQVGLGLWFCILALSACATTGKVEGRITLDGNPLANIKVELAEGKNTIPTTQTDVNGRFVFADVPPDTYALGVTLESEGIKCVVVTPAEVKAGEQFTHDFIFDKTVYLSGGYGMGKSGEVIACGSK
jgi:hypothetical protein